MIKIGLKSLKPGKSKGRQGLPWRRVVAYA
jgi:hypothetical protein